MKELTDRNVLIVEDDFNAGLELMRALSEKGCRTKLVRTIEGALQELSADRPDVATLDLDVHGKISTPVEHALVAQQVPFVIVAGTTQDVPSDRFKGRMVCRKPFVAGEVVMLLTTAIKQSKAA